MSGLFGGSKQTVTSAQKVPPQIQRALDFLVNTSMGLAGNQGYGTQSAPQHYGGRPSYGTPYGSDGNPFGGSSGYYNPMTGAYTPPPSQQTPAAPESLVPGLSGDTLAGLEGMRTAFSDSNPSVQAMRDTVAGNYLDANPYAGVGGNRYANAAVNPAGINPNVGAVSAGPFNPFAGAQAQTMGQNPNSGSVLPRASRDEGINPNPFAGDVRGGINPGGMFTGGPQSNPQMGSQQSMQSSQQGLDGLSGNRFTGPADTAGVNPFTQEANIGDPNGFTGRADTRGLNPFTGAAGIGNENRFTGRADTMGINPATDMAQVAGPSPTRQAQVLDINPFLEGADLDGQSIDDVSSAIMQRANRAVSDRFSQAGRGGSGAEATALAAEVATQLAPFAFNARDQDLNRTLSAETDRLRRGFEGYESLAGRVQGADEASLARRFAGQESYAGRDLGAQESALGRQFSGFENEAVRDLGAQESALGRGFSADESMAGRRLTSDMDALGRGFAGYENEAGRDLAAQESALGRGFESDEARAARQYGASSDAIGRAFGGFESEAGRGFAANTDSLNRGYGADESALGRTFADLMEGRQLAFQGYESAAGRDFASQADQLARGFAADESGLDRGYGSFENERGRQTEAIANLLGIPAMQAQQLLNTGNVLEEQSRAERLEPFERLNLLLDPLVAAIGGAPRTQTTTGRSRNFSIGVSASDFL